MVYKLSSEQVESFRHQLLDWFADNKRDLPWRRTYTPYHVWISEIMGQQTQIERVALYFNRWIEQFPDISTVAESKEQHLLKAWEGLGYYSRVRNIQRTAIALMNVHGGAVPREYKALLALPGIGPYTAAAIMSIAFNMPFPLIDANVERVYARLADIDTPVKAKETRKRLEALATDYLDTNEPRNFNQALMELGALVCTPKNPSCSTCPVRSHCRAFDRDTVDLRPIPGKKVGKINITMACGIIMDQDRFYIQQRKPDDIWGGLWEFPGGRLKEGETPEQAVVREVLEETEIAVTGLKPFKSVIHYYTRYKVTLHGFFCQTTTPVIPVLHAATDYAWVKIATLDAYPYPAGHRQLVAALNSIFPEKR